MPHLYCFLHATVAFYVHRFLVLIRVLNCVKKWLQMKKLRRFYFSAMFSHLFLFTASEILILRSCLQVLSILLAIYTTIVKEAVMKKSGTL